MKKTIIITAAILALYAIAGWHQRGWFDWLGVATLAFLVAPAAHYFGKEVE